MDVEELVQSVDIVEYISQYVDLEERNGEYWGLSPFKQEKTPSFSVRKEPPFFYDFSSGMGGNLIAFVKAYKSCSSSEAIREIEAYSGVDPNTVTVRQRLSAVGVMKSFRKSTTTKESKTKPLAPDYMSRYEDKDEKLSVWYDEGISKEAMKRFEVKYDAFSNRIVYPIRDLSGNIVNVGGRTLDPDWKEKDLRKYCYFFPWGTMNTIYGVFENMDEILRKKEVILFEGCKSVLIADTWGIRNTGAILTSHLNSNQLKILAKLGCRVVFALDNDINVLRDKNIEKLRRYVKVEYLTDNEHRLSPKDSPVDRGYDTFEQLYNERKTF